MFLVGSEYFKGVHILRVWGGSKYFKGGQAFPEIFVPGVQIFLKYLFWGSIFGGVHFWGGPILS